MKSPAQPSSDQDNVDPERILASARERMAAYQQGGNLSRSGVPVRPVRGHDLDAAPEKSTRQVDREVTGDTIDVLGVLRYRPRGRPAAPEHSKGEALKRRSDFSKPLSRPGRPVNSDGATSFHFSCNAMSQTRNGVVQTKETERWLAPQHVSYLERDAAVAKLNSAAAEAIISAAAGGLYIEREAAVAEADDDGAKAIYSNISKDPEERQHFWRLVEAHARKPGPDKLEFDVEADPEFWSAVAEAAACPIQLRATIEAAVPGTIAVYEGGNNEELRRLFTDYGWQPPEGHDAEGADLGSQPSPRRDCGTVFRDGRGEVVQLRLVGELPNELSMEGKGRVLTRFSSFFEDRELPYVSVMHAPDHTNNGMNWHFHLAAYERPCRRFGNHKDFIRKLPPGASKLMRWNDTTAREAIASGELGDFEGEWDFAVPVTWTDSSRHPKTSYPFQQIKDRECNDKGFPEQMRQLLAEICNDELQKEGHDRRYDPRTFDAMGISKSGDSHLGTKGAQLEKFGVPTPLGQKNEAKQWDAIVGELNKDLQARLFEAQHTAKQARFDIISMQDPGTTHLQDLVSDWENTVVDAELTQAAAVELQQILNRSQSRAMFTRKECEHYLAAIEAGSASQRQIRSRKLFELRLAEANDHLAGTNVFFADQRRDLIALQSRHTVLRQSADRLIGEVQKALTPAHHCAQQDGQRGMLNKAPAVQVGDELRPQLGPAFPDRNLDDLIENILEKNRRLVSFEGRVLLRDASPTEATLMASIPTGHAASRIRGIQKRQDGLILELQRVLEKEPTRLRIVRSRDGAERLSLQVDRPDLQRAFRSWAFEPEVKPFVQRAVECNEEAARLKKERGRIERAIEQVTVTAIPIQRVSDGAQPRFALDSQFLLEVGVVAKDLSSPLGQRLLAQAHEVQTNDVQRLAAFAGKFPGRIIPSPDAGKGDLALIISKGPPDLQSLALRYRHHPAAQQALRIAFESNLPLRSTAVTRENKVGVQHHSEAHRAAAAMPSIRQGKE